MLMVVLQLFLLLAVAIGCGALAVGRRASGTPLSGWVGTAGLTGLCAAAFWLHTTGIRGWVPFWLSGGLLGLAAIGGWVRVVRGPRLPGSGWRREALTLVPVLLLTASPFILGISGPSMAYDSVACWWPAGLEVAEAGATPDPVSEHRFRLRPEYARGLAWLYVLGGAGSAPEARFLRLVTLLFWPLTALLLMDFGARRGAPGGAWMAGMLVLCLPDVGAQACSGLADVPLGAAVALCGVGLTLAPGSSAGFWMAILGALGAATLKDEGFVVWAAVCAVLLLRAIRGRLGWRPTLVAAGSLALTFPGLWWRSLAESSALRPSALGALRVMGHEPGFLIGRLADLPGAAWDRLLAHWAGIGDADRVLESGWAVAIVALLAVLVILPRGRRDGVVLAPALILLAALAAATLVNPLALAHQLDSSVDRFAAQLTPLLLLGACERLWTTHRTPEDSAGKRPEV